jgi:rare lipoprotein A
MANLANGTGMQTRPVGYVAIAIVTTAFYGCFAPTVRMGSPGEQRAVRVTPVSATIPEADASALKTQEGVASYYADEFNGRKTSNGEVFDMNKLTCAHLTYPFGTILRVVNLDNGKACEVRVNDRGPFVDNRIIDLSYGAAKEVGLIGPGTARVRLEVIEWGGK